MIVRDLVAGPRRFVELQRVLPGISTEQLRSRLNRMVADGLLTRQRYREVPPRVDYELTERARDLLPVVGALARWGARWAWSPPRPDESVDIGAILRTVPGLTLPGEIDGMVEITVVRRAGDMKRYVLTARHGHMELAERSAPEADARIAGPERAWIEALGPRRLPHGAGDHRRSGDGRPAAGRAGARRGARDARGLVGLDADGRARRRHRACGFRPLGGHPRLKPGRLGQCFSMPGGDSNPHALAGSRF